jgi:hypothetical protein
MSSRVARISKSVSIAPADPSLRPFLQSTKARSLQRSFSKSSSKSKVIAASSLSERLSGLGLARMGERLVPFVQNLSSGYSQGASQVWSKLIALDAIQLFPGGPWRRLSWRPSKQAPGLPRQDGTPNYQLERTRPTWLWNGLIESAESAGDLWRSLDCGGSEWCGSRSKPLQAPGRQCIRYGQL